MKKGNTERQIMTMYETKLADKQEINEKSYVVTKYTVTFPPHQISIVSLTPINYTENIQTNTLLEMEENPFFMLVQPNIIIILA